MGNTNANEDEDELNHTILPPFSPLNGSQIVDTVISSELSNMGHVQISHCYMRLTDADADVIFRIASGHDYHCHLVGKGSLRVEIKRISINDTHKGPPCYVRTIDDLLNFLQRYRTDFVYDRVLSNSKHFAMAVMKFLSATSQT